MPPPSASSSKGGCIWLVMVLWTPVYAVELSKVTFAILGFGRHLYIESFVMVPHILLMDLMKCFGIFKVSGILFL